MTAQIPDQFGFEGHCYSLVGVKGGTLFDPHQFGLNPVGICSACWRGYQCWYTVADNRLLLTRLGITLKDLPGTLDTPFGPSPDGEFLLRIGPEVQGACTFAPDPKHSFHNNLYDNLNLEIQYTGQILIADRFIKELYVHMGFHPAWKYETVLELAFEEGRLLQARDASGRIKIIRSLMRQMPMRPGLHTEPSVHLKWIESTFSLDYD